MSYRNLVLGLAFASGMLACAPLAFAQADLGSKTVSSLEYREADVRDALDALFKQVGASYSIDQSVQGRITVSLHNVSLGAALKNILLQVDAEAKIEDGIYRIMSRPPADSPAPQNSQPVATGSNKIRKKVKVNHADPMVLAEVLTNNGKPDFRTASAERSTVIQLDEYKKKYNWPGGFQMGIGGSRMFGGGGF